MGMEALYKIVVPMFRTRKEKNYLYEYTMAYSAYQVAEEACGLIIPAGFYERLGRPRKLTITIAVEPEKKN